MSPRPRERALAVDTSVAVPLLTRSHAAHRLVAAWRAGRRLAICGHAWLETYAVLTRLPGPARVEPGDAVRLLVDHFARPLDPGPGALGGAVEALAAKGVAGGAAYDGWIALTALEHGARLASRDARAEATYRRLGAEVEMVAG